MTFNWHEQPRDSWLSWFLIHVVAEDRKGDNRFEELSEITDKFTKVDLKIVINGIEFDGEHFIEQLEKNFDWAVDRKAQELAEQAACNLDKIQEVVDDAARDLRISLRDKLEGLGVKIRDEEEW